jgi:hypothetical protein
MKKIYFVLALSLLLCWCTINSWWTSAPSMFSSSGDDSINQNSLQNDTQNIHDIDSWDNTLDDEKIWDDGENNVIVWDKDTNIWQDKDTNIWFSRVKWFDSPWSGNVVITWRLTTELAFDSSFFVWNEDLLENCKTSPALWWTDECPTKQIVVIKSTGVEFPWELFLTTKRGKMVTNDTIKLWCIENREKIDSNPIAQWIRWAIMSNETESTIIERLDRIEPTTFLISKSAYNLNNQANTDCDVTFQWIDILD